MLAINHKQQALIVPSIVVIVVVDDDDDDDEDGDDTIGSISFELYTRCGCVTLYYTSTGTTVRWKSKIHFFIVYEHIFTNFR